MGTIKGYELLAKALKRQGVDTMFFLLGGPMTTTETACIRKEGIRGIDVRHEQAAAMMAHGYSRSTNKVGVCVAASGPGTINLATGISCSWADCVPVVALGGSCSSQELGNGTFQEVDQVALMQPITKWADRVYETRRFPEMINKAFLTATSGKRGPVYLDFPGDILHDAIDEDTVVWPDYGRAEIGRPSGDPATIEKAINLLASARKPVLIWGSGALWSEASPALRAFVDKTGIPFFPTPQSRGAVPDDHPYCYSFARNTAFKEADVVLIVGTRPNYVIWHLRSPRFSESVKFIRVDIDENEIATTPRLDVGIVGDARRVLEQFNDALDKRVHAGLYEEWRGKLKAENEKRAEAQRVKMANDQVPIHPWRMCREIKDFMDRDAILVVDGQDILAFGRASLPTFVPNHRINSGVFGCMGVGLPYALGAKAAHPDKQVICVHGDGSFGLNAMELDTAARHKLPIITIISLNGGWTADPKKSKAGRDLGFTRFDKMAEALGCHGEWVEKPADIRPALERAKAAVARGQPALVNVKVDENAEAQPGRFTRYMT